MSHEPRPIRRGGTLIEVVVAMVLLYVCLIPALNAMKTQIKDTRWSVERRLAIQVSNDVLDLYQQMGYHWIRREIGYFFGPQGLGNPDGWGRTDRLCYDSTSGFNPVTAFPVGRPAPPCSLNPALGGPFIAMPGPVAQPTPPPSGVFNFTRPVDQDPGGRGSLARATLENVYGFRRRVEIFGGDQGVGFNPFPLVPAFRPGPPGPPLGECYLVRVTINTQRGTMATASDAYQVVTVIAAH